MNSRPRMGALLVAPVALILSLIVAIPLLFSQNCDLPTRTGPTSDAVSVMTWNLCAYSCDDWAGRSARMASEVSRYSPDIVALQEAGWGSTNFSHTRRAMTALGYVTAHDGEPFANRYVFYNPAKFTAGDSGKIDLGGADGIAWSVLETKADGGRMLIVNTHLAAGGDADGRRASQMNSAVSQLKPQMNRTASIWLGDFNSHQDRADDAPARILKAAGHVNARDIATDKRNAKTDSYRGRESGARVSNNGRQYDHIYVDQSITVSAWQQVVNADRQGNYTGPFTTDHNAVQAVVSVPLSEGADSREAATADRADSTGSPDAHPAAASDITSVGRWNTDQVKNAAVIAAVGKKLGVPDRGRAIAIMTAMGESSLQVLDRGDSVGPDSRGLFQQRDNGAWGTYEDRMNPAKSAEMFYRALLKVAGWQELQPTEAAHRVQRNADPNHYAKFWDEAVAAYAAVSNVNLNEATAAVAPACLGDDLSQVSYLSGADCDFPGVNNPNSCQEALAKAAQIVQTSACKSPYAGGTWRRWCLAFTAHAYGRPAAGYPTAISMYQDMKRRGLISTSKEIPAGALVFFNSGDPAGHVALYAGNGMAFSNDYIRSGCIDLTPMARMGSGGRYLGWSPPAFPGS